MALQVGSSASPQVPRSSDLDGPRISSHVVQDQHTEDGFPVMLESEHSDSFLNVNPFLLDYVRLDLIFCSSANEKQGKDLWMVEKSLQTQPFGPSVRSALAFLLFC